MMRRTVRLAPLLVAALAAGWVLSLGGTPRAEREAVTYLAYRVPAGENLEFAVEPGDRDLTLGVSLVVTDPHSMEPRHFAVGLELRDASGEITWTGRAVLESPPGGGVMDGETPITESRQLRLSLPEISGAPARLTVRLEPGANDSGASGDSGDTAVIRLLRRAPRATHLPNLANRIGAGTRRLGDRASLFGWAYLDEEAIAAIRAEPIRRRAATGEAKLVRITVADDLHTSVAPVTLGEGELVGPDAAAAWTVVGPGALRLLFDAVDPSATVTATIRTIDNLGAVTETTLEVGRDGALYDLSAPAGGALTAEVFCADAAGLRARAMAMAGARQLGAPADEPLATASRATEITPDRRQLTVWRLTPGGPNLYATLSGDGLARVIVRPAAPFSDEVPFAPPRLAWRLLDADGKVTASGTTAASVQRSLFKTHTGSAFRGAADGAVADFAGEPVIFVAAGEPGSVLELTAGDLPFDVSLEATDLELGAEIDPAYDVPLADARLRYAPFLRRRWSPFRPDNHAELSAAGARRGIEAQVRLEPAGPVVEPVGPYQVILPYGPRVQQNLVELTERPSRWKSFHRAGFATNDTVRLRVAAGGADAGRLELDYAVSSDALGGVLRVQVDGVPMLERRIVTTRGRLRLRNLPAGEHDIRVVGAPGQILTRAVATAGAKAYAERATYRIWRGGTLTVPVVLGAGQTKTLHAVVYTEDMPSAPLQVRAVVDGGTRRMPALHSTGGRTRTKRDLTRLAVPAVTRWLDRAGDADARAVFAVRLGPDLGAGNHDVRLTLLDGVDRAHVRFFVTGLAQEVAEPSVGVEWAED